MNRFLFSNILASQVPPTASELDQKPSSSSHPGIHQRAVECLAGIMAILVVFGLEQVHGQATTFNYTGGVQTYTVPVGVTAISVDVYGAAGYGLQGYGGRVQADHPVTPGEVLNIYVGGTGSEGAGGFNGGGNPGTNTGYAGGGGGSDIRRGGTALSNRIIIAGGGGGSGSNCGTWTAEGGHGGGLTGQSGCAWSCSDCQYTGGGGTQSAGGIAGPTGHSYCGGNQNGSLGQGGNNTSNGYGTGGGGGYYGGGSGCFEGAGGGSSFTGPLATNVIHTQGVRTGNGMIVITPLNVTAPCATPTSVTATPASICVGQSTNLNAISAGNNIAWFTVPTGGTAIGTVGSGVNFLVTPGATTTYYAEAQGIGGTSGSQTFNYTGGLQTFTVPPGVTTISVDAMGAQGGNGGLGGRIQTNISVTPGQTLNIYVGGQGNTGSGAAGGYNGGGNAGGTYGTEGSGGGASDIRIGGTALANRVVVAGGGGGVGGWAGGAGGSGGGTTGVAGGAGQAGGGGGGTQVSGGAGGTPNGGSAGGSGSIGQGGNGGFTNYGGGGGGGGYYGGGGGGADTDPCCADGGGGGGGSSYSSGGSIVHTQGYRSGAGQIILSWTGVSCTASARVPVTVTVVPLPAAPTPVTATPPSICIGGTSQLNATSSGNTINWYTVATGGTSIGSSASGANFAVTPGSTTTYYAEAVTSGGGSGSQTFNYTGAPQSFTVPPGVTSLTFDVQGAQGGQGYGVPGVTPGLGGRVTGTITVTPGEVIQVNVGGVGGNGGTTVGGTAGYNGGGVGGGWSGGRSGGGGGGASDIRRGGTALSNRVIVGAGGGGTGVNHSTGDAGGNGGGLNGVNGLTGTYLGGGASQAAGGTPNGALGIGGAGGTGQTGGGGGGGYYGGGGSAWEGGGGGSSYCTAVGTASVVHATGYKTGNGLVVLSWTGSSVSCASATRTPVTVTVTGTPAAPTPVTASPTSICVGNSSNLNGTSTGNTINWYTVATGGTSIGSSASGANFAVTPGSTTTYYAEASAGGGSTSGSQTFNYTGGVQTFTVPSGVTSITVDAFGAQGGNAVGNAVGWVSGPVNVSGGLGGRVQATVAVTPGQTINVYVGGQGTTTTGGFNGGGAPATCAGGTEVIWAGGGGASDLRIGGTALANRVLVAGGGGGSAGSGNTYQGVGGVGGGLTGGNGTFTGGGCMFGSGGSQAAGGTGGNNTCWCGTGATSPAGALGNGGSSVCAPSGLSTCSCSGTGCVSGAGGGGGYYGGGSSLASSGAGGGSSYAGAGTSGVTHTQGTRTGNGQITISWTGATSPCVSTTRTAVTVTVNTTQPSPSPVTANPSSICAGATTNLNATSPGNTINWYTVATGGTAIGSSASGANFPVTPGSTITYYAETAGSGGGGSGSQTFNYTGSIQSFTVPVGVTSITIDARGAQGGGSNGGAGGLGARMNGTYAVTPGQVLSVVVGQQGLLQVGGNAQNSSGGGGGTFVFAAGPTLLVAAGGGGGKCNYTGSVPLHSGAAGQITTNGGASSDGNAGGTGGNGGNAGLWSSVPCAGGGTGWLTNGGGPYGGIGYNTWTGGPGFCGGGGGGCGGVGGWGGGGGGGNHYGGGGGGGGYSGGGGGTDPTHGGGGGSFSSGTSQSNTAGFQAGNGQVIIAWTGSGGCAASPRVPVTVTVGAPPVTANAGPDQTVCGNTATLAGNSPGAGTGAWSIISGAGGSVTTPSSPTSTFTGTPGTTYTLRWTVSNPPCANSTDDVIITLVPAPTTANAGPNQTVCATSTTLAANTVTTGTGSWSIVSGGGGTVTTPSSPTSAFSGVSGTTYTLRWTTSNPPCANSTDDVLITFTGNPTTANAGPDQTVCATSVTLAANTPTTGTGSWSIVSGAGGTVTTPSSPTSAFSGTAGTTYTLRWTISNPPCANSTDDVVITLRANPTTANAGPDQTLCATGATLAGNTPTVGTGSWSIVSGGGGSIATPSSPTSAFSGVAGTTYTLRWTTSNPPCANSTDDVIITLTAPPTTANAGPDQTVCATSVTLAATAPTTGTGSWSIVSGAGGTVTTPGSATSAFTGVANTTYTLRWTTSNPPCTNSTDDVIITLRGNPTAANAGPDQTVCATTVTLAANTPTVGTGSWSIVSGAGGTVTTPGSATSTFTGTAGTVYTLRWTTSNPPCANSTDDVVITLTGNPTVANAGPNQNVCATSTTLAANTPTTGTGSWSIVSGAGGTITTPSSPTSAFTGTTGTVYTLRWTISNAPCSPSTDDVVITLTGNPTVANAGPDQTVCATTVTLAGNTPSVGTGSWSIVSGAGGTIATPSSPTSSFTGTAGTVYTLRWTISNAPCSPSSDDVVISLTGNPTVANAGPDQNVCGTSVTLVGNTPTTGTGTWSIVSGAGGTIAVPTSATTTFTGVQGTVYTLRWTINNAPCAPSSDDVVITMTANPTAANAGADQTICATSTSLSANPPAVGAGTWTIVSGTGGTAVSPTSPTSAFNGSAGQVYTIRWTIANSPCPASSDDVLVTMTTPTTVANAGPDQNVCGTSVTLVANTPTSGTGSWSILSGAGGSIAVPSSATTTFSGVAGTVYTLRWTITNPPCAPTTDDVVITLTANPTAANAGADQTICATATTLSANPPAVGAGTWTIVNGTGGTAANPTSPTSAFTGLGGQVYTIRWTIANSPCPASSDDVVVTMTGGTTTANAGPDQTVCSSSATLVANTPTFGVGSWSIVSGAGGSITAPSSPTTAFSGVTGTVYTLRWTITNPPCAPSTDDVIVTLTGNPTVANAGPDQTVCAASVTLAGNTATVGTGSWSIITGAGGTVTTPTSPTSGFTGVPGTVYTLRWTISNAPCSPSTDDVVITLTGTPSTPNAGPDQNVCGTTANLFANTPSVGTGVWSIVSGAGGSIGIPTSPTTAFTGVPGTVYILRWTISNPPCTSLSDDVQITFTSPTTVANAGPDQTVCGGSATLAGNTPTSGTGTWTIIFGAGGTVTTPSSPTSGFTGTPGTTYLLRWTIDNAPCASTSDDVVITLTGNPTTANAGPDQTVCGNTTNLFGNSPTTGTGLWSIVSGAGGSIATPTSATTAFTGVPGTVYTLRWTITNAPCAPVSDDVVITLTGSPTVADAGPDQTVCGSTVTLAGNTATVGTGTWTIVSGAGGTVTTPSSPTSGFSGAAGTVYTLRWTITNAPCAPTSDDVVITLTANPSTANAGTDQTICGTTASLVANTPTVGTGLWTIVSGVGGTIVSPTSPTSTFNGTAGTVYTLRWTISNAPCAPVSDDVVVTLVGTPTTANAGPDQTVCATTVTLAGNTATVGTGAWTIVSGTGGTVTTPSSPTSGFTGTAGTVYTLRWTISNAPCAPSSDDVVITLTGNPTTPNAGPDQNICGTSANLIANTPTVGTGLWSIVSGAGGTIATPTSATSSFTGVAGTVYTLRWTITNAPCSALSDDVQITFTANPTVANAGPDQTVCGTAVTLAGNTATIGTGTWTIVSGAGGSIAAPSSPTSAFTGTAGAVYTLRWTIDNAPCAPTSDDVVITLTGSPTVATAGPDQNICGTSAILAGNTPTVGTGTWSIVSGGAGSFGSTTNPNSTFTGIAGNTYILRWTIVNPPCAPTFDEVQVAFTGASVPANAGPDQTICDTITTLQGNTPTSGSGFWTIINGIGGTIVSPTSPNSQFITTSGNVFTLRWTIVNSPCPTTFDAVVITTDIVAPTISCPGPLSVSTNSNQCSAVVGFTSPVGLDNCPGSTTTLTSGIPSGGTFPVGTTVNTYMVTDISGATATCSFSITVSDNQAPVAICQSVTVQLDNTGNGSTTASAVNNGSSDACGLASVSLSQTTFNCADVGVNTETLTVVDNNGNSSSCAAAITVQDLIAPVAICQPLTVQLSGTGTATATAANANNGSTDACGIQGFTLVPATYNCANVGTVNAVLTVADVNGNTSTCAVAVTVEDNIVPTAVCQNITVQLNGAGTATVTGSQLDNGSADGCGIATLSASVGSYNCGNVGPNTNVLTVTDNNGNTSSCTASVTVQDLVAPNAICQNVTVVLSGTGTGSTTTTAVDNGSSDACGILSMSLSQSSFNCTDVGVNAEVLTVTDVNSNSSTCAVNITVQDNSVPTALCQNVTAQLGTNGTATVAATSVDNGSSDACSGSTLTFNLVPSNFTCSDVGNVPVVLTVTDGQGNSSTCNATVAVVDAMAPTAVCQDVTVNLDINGNGSTNANAIAGSSTDNCGIQTMTVSPTTFTCANVGANSVTVTITDVNGNTSTCVRNAQVQDVNAPVANCQSVTVQLDQNGSAIALTSNVDNGSTDNCGISTRTVVPSVFNCSNVGSNSVVFTVTDVNGNTSTCATTVVVQDVNAPNAVCQNVTVTLDANGDGSTSAIAVNNGSTDNCGISTTTLNGGAVVNYTCANIGSNSGSLVVTDVNGNSSSCNALITVVDNMAPTMTCPANQTLMADSTTCGAIATWTVPSVTDNCGSLTATGNHAPGSLFTVGTTTVTYSATDGSGNFGSCSFDIVVTARPLLVNTTSPLVGCGFNLACAADQNAPVTTQVSGGCLPYSFLWSNGATTQNLAGVGAGSYTLTVTDFRGSTATSSIVITAPAPLAATTTGTALLCVGSTTGTATVTASGGQTCQPYSYLWSTGATTTTITGLSAGAFTVTVTDAMGCVVVDTFEIAQGTVAFVNLGANVTVCPGVPHTFSTTGQFSTYQWSNGSTSMSILVAAPGTYSLTATTQDGCVDADTVVLANYVVDNDIITASGPTAICPGTTLTLTGDAGLTGYDWNTGATTQAITVNSAGSYILSANDANNCVATDTVVVTTLPWNEPLPQVTPNPAVICPGDSVTLDVGNFYTSYAWSNGATTQTITVSTGGTFTVTVTNSSGCTEASPSALVTMGTTPNPVLVFNLGVLSTTQPYGTYQWVLNGNPIPGATSSTYTPGIPGIYTVIVTDVNGCPGESNEILYDPTAIGDQVENLEGLVLYPNPGRDVVNLRALSPIDWPLQVEIWDMFGHKVRSYDMAHLMDLASFDLSDLAAAPYTMKITTYRHNKTQQATIRFVLQ